MTLLEACVLYYELMFCTMWPVLATCQRHFVVPKFVPFYAGNSSVSGVGDLM